MSFRNFPQGNIRNPQFFTVDFRFRENVIIKITDDFCNFGTLFKSSI